MPELFFTPTGVRIRLLLVRLIRAFPAKQREWGQAMIAELEGIRGFWPRMEWITGGMMAMANETLRSLLTRWLEEATR